MNNKSLFKNSFFSILQTIAMAVAALVLFKLMVLNLGLKVTGLWSFLSSITTITSFGSFGFANALLFFLPRFQIQQDRAKANSLVNTTFVCVTAFSVILCLLAYLIFNYIIPFTVEQELVPTAKKLLPYITFSFFFAALSTTYLSTLDGMLLMHLRSKITIAGSVIFLIAGYVLLLKLGIIGVPIALLIQNIFLLLTSYFFVRKNLSQYRFRFSLNKELSREIFKYGFNFQMISLTQIISEPFMKALITKYSGSHITAIFDICVKLLSVFRSLIIAANQSVVPLINIFKIKGKLLAIQSYFNANFRLVFYVSLIMFVSPIALSDAISLAFLNERSSDFNFTMANIAFGLLINALAFPAHFFYLGLGKLKWIVINNVVTATLIFISVPLIGEFVGGKYVVLGWSLSAVVGSSLLMYSFYKENQKIASNIFNKDVFSLLGALLAAIIINHFLNYNNPLALSSIALIAASFGVLVLCLVVPVLTNPVFRKLIRKRFKKPGR